MSQAVTRVNLLSPGPLSRQGVDMAARLQLCFPPSLFHFKYLPTRLNREAWKALTQGNQPFLGLGFVGMAARGEDEVYLGTAKWMLVCAVRRQGTPQSRLFGDAAPGGIGVMDMATAAIAVLNGAVCGTGSVLAGGVSNLQAEDWSDDTAAIAIELNIGMRLAVAELISNPGENIFEDLATTWNVPTPDGSIDTYSSDWKNPYVPT